jgi:creatinine amidohydrolase/Fe(II)-dependent formamide hydrolase-like protein
MFIKSKELNRGNEVATHSTASIEKFDRERTCYIPIIETESDSASYDEFVEECPHVLILPPIQKRLYCDEFFLDVRRAVPGVVTMPIEKTGSHRMKGAVALASVDPVEAHGFHLPVSADVLRGSGIARLISQTNDDCVVFPPISYGCTSESENRAGFTVPVDMHLLELMVERYATDIAEISGADAVVLFTGHNFDEHRIALRRGLQKAKRNLPKTEFFHIFDFDLLEGESGPDGEKINIRGHADRKETSVLMHYDRLWGTKYVSLSKESCPRGEEAVSAQMVRPRSRILQGYEISAQLQGWPVVNGFGRYDPRKSNAEYGEFLADKIIHNACRLIGQKEGYSFKIHK